MFSHLKVTNLKHTYMYMHGTHMLYCLLIHCIWTHNRDRALFKFTTVLIFGIKFMHSKVAELISVLKKQFTSWR